ncbi:MAG TPA: oxygen-independent coproporphyrinogen III oxidase [Rudaea sp.]|nr:oxygen-independent coproporphyrinogen III oxidase [Rudaea sp.]
MKNHATAAEFDAALIARYDTTGPRYTSYPAATSFHAGFGEAQLRDCAADSNDEPIPRPLSLYVHVPFCMSPCFYCGCNRIITRDVRLAERYLASLYREIEMVAGMFDRDRQVVQLHFGGGTPNFLDARQMSELMDSLERHFAFARTPTREFGIEIDPRYADAAYIHALGALGFNRMSVGIQDFDPQVQQAVNRIQSIEQTREVIDAARESGFRSVSVDLIYGLPKQTIDGFSRTLEQVAGLCPDRIAAYGYAHLPQLFKAQKQLDAHFLPDAATRLQLLGRALEMLGAAGYVYIGMDHFARVDDELAKAQRDGSLQRNFQGYSTFGQCDIVGLGVSAISRIGNSYSQNARELPGYYAALDNGSLPVARGVVLNEDDLIRRELIGELMCHGKLDIRGFAQRHRLKFPVYFADSLTLLEPLKDDGLVELNNEKIAVTARGRLLLRNIAMCFDAYARSGTQVRHSRVI